MLSLSFSRTGCSKFLKGEIADKQCHPKHFCEGMTHIFLTDEGEKLAPSYFYLN
jgi:hypothetical protein